MKNIVDDDVRIFKDTFPLWKNLKDASLLITGATGLIGSILTKCLLALGQNISITIPVRNKKKAYSIFGTQPIGLRIIECNLLEYLQHIDEKFDYVIHLASPTSGKYICRYPTETYELTIETTRCLLRYADANKIKGMIYVSSLEYYGENSDDNVITEDRLGYIDMASPRSAYPMGKRSAEFLCTSYAIEYGVPVKIARLTQTFGAGVTIDDNRVFAQFARSIINGTDIVLHTTGKSSKPYCYTTDCVSALLYILLKGKLGEAYNVANQSTYISIIDLAYFLVKNFSNGINVIIEEHLEMGYAPITKLNLSDKKLKDLGWRPHYGLYEMFNRLIESLK